MGTPAAWWRRALVDLQVADSGLQLKLSLNARSGLPLAIVIRCGGGGREFMHAIPPRPHDSHEHPGQSGSTLHCPIPGAHLEATVGAFEFCVQSTQFSSRPACALCHGPVSPGDDAQSWFACPELT